MMRLCELNDDLLAIKLPRLLISSNTQTWHIACGEHHNYLSHVLGEMPYPQTCGVAAG
jgi:hypothetical protein